MTGSSDHFDTKPQVIGGKRSINPFEICPEVVGENESSKLLETDTAVSNGSHRTSSLEELLQVDTGCSLRSFTQSASKGDEVNGSNGDYSKSKGPDKWSPGPTSTSQVSKITHDLLMHDTPQTQSPPMDRSEEHYHHRIPSSVLEGSKYSIRGERNVGSNESLFSIPIDNNSLSGDHFKSGELPKSSEFIMFNPSLTIPEVETDKDGAEFKKSGASVQSFSNVTKEPMVDRSQEKAPAANVLQNPSQFSDNSNDISRSFTFPIKKKKKKKNCACVPFSCCRKKCRGKKGA